MISGRSLILACLISTALIAADEFEMHPVFGKIPAQGTLAREVWELKQKSQSIGELKADLMHLREQLNNKIKEVEAKLTVHENKLKMVEKHLYETEYNKKGFK